MTNDPTATHTAIAGPAPEPVTPARQEKTIGFPASAGPASPEISRGPSTPRRVISSTGTARLTPKRPKGRWFISLFICTIGLLVGHKIWTEFGQNQAYGVMQGRVLEIRTPWSGIIESMHVRDGQKVEQGQLLATINNFELRNEQIRLRHQLEIALAELAMRVADIQSREQTRADSELQLQVEQFQLLGRLHAERARLEELDNQYRINRGLFNTRSVSQTELESTRIQLASQQSVVDELNNALETLQTSLEQMEQRGDSVLQPLILQQKRIQSIESEFSRLSELESLGEIRAPVQGRIVRRQQFTGEFIAKNTSIFELLEHDSLEAVLYLPQTRADHFEVGDEINLVLPPESIRRVFRIRRFGDQMVSPPESIERFYNSRQRLIPVYAVPVAGQLPNGESDGTRFLGAEVRLPRLGVRPGTSDSWWNRLTGLFFGF